MRCASGVVVGNIAGMDETSVERAKRLGLLNMPIGAELKERVRDAAAREERSMAAFVRLALAERLARIEQERRA